MDVNFRKIYFSICLNKKIGDLWGLWKIMYVSGKKLIPSR